MNAATFQKALHGITSIAVTPMTPSGDVDYQGLKKHIRFLIDHGINKDRAVVVVGGSTGECGGMTIDERKRVIEAAIAEAGADLPVVAGCNHTCTADGFDLMRHAKDAGAAGVMVLAPYYYVPTDECVLRFYREISEKVDIGIMLYNNFEVTHKDVPVSVLASLAGNSNVVGIKECSPNFVKMERLARTCGHQMAIINGHGEFLEPFAALAGTVGFLSSTSNFAPGIAVEMWEARSKGEYEKAKQIRDRLSPYLDLAADASATGGEPIVLAILKRAAELVGSCGGTGRLPLLPISTELDARIQNMLRQVGLV